MNFQFSVLLQENKKLGHLLHPFHLQATGKDYLVVADRLSAANMNYYRDKLTETEIKIIELVEEYSDLQLAKRFTNKKVNPREFVKNLDDEYVSRFVRPFVERQMAKCISLMAEKGINLFIRENKNIVYLADMLTPEPKPAEIVFNFVKNPTETHYYQTIRHNNQIINLTRNGGKIITNNPCWLQLNYRLYHFTEQVDGKKLSVFFDKAFIQVPQRLEENYYSTFVKKCIQNFPVHTEGFELRTVQPDIRSLLTLEHDFEGLPGLHLTFAYGEKIVNPTEPGQKFVFDKKEKGIFWFDIINRDIEFEKSKQQVLIHLGLVKVRDNKYVVHSTEENGRTTDKYNLLRWLNNNAKALTDAGIRVDDAISNSGYFTGEISMEIRQEEKNDWFDVHAVARFGDEFEIPIIKLRKYLLEGIREYPLPNGKIAILPEHWFEKYADLLQVARYREGRIMINRWDLPLMEKALGDLIDISSESYQSKIARLIARNRFKVPSGLKAELRSYQSEGFQWLNAMRNSGLGGCLADDMGLGKTLQTLSLLLKYKQDTAGATIKSAPAFNGQFDLFSQPIDEEPKVNPSLVVMPASLIHNWENEIRKFTPTLRHLVYTGQQRSDLVSKFEFHDIILSTYGTVRNDIQVLEKVKFGYVILDESQVIKNPASKVSKAVYRLNCAHRLTISGTPIENTLTDLWSQMHFLNRGLLGDQAFFRKFYTTPIEKNGETEKRDKLLALIRPFILRRTKSQVEKELPELSEEIIYCEMSAMQERAYLTEKSSIRNFILENIEKQGASKSAIVVLQALTKLRQMANHPVLIDESYKFDSGKFSEVIRNLHTLLSEGHKVLIFSSFVKHLNLLSAYFDQNNIGYSMLTGETVNRAQVVKEFQTDERRKVFLISTKAGGVGLNLTQASYVFLLEPWWNPAVENQAISRAHRIGQTQHVICYRFISLGTIEEKIVRLQQKKSTLSEIFIRSDNPLNDLNVNQINELIN